MLVKQPQAADPEPVVVVTSTLIAHLDRPLEQRNNSRLMRAVLQGNIEPHGTRSTYSELTQKLEELSGKTHPSDRRRYAQARTERILRYAQVLDPPPLEKDYPKCADPNDQMFINCAVHHHIPYLISRDEAILDMAEVMYGLGVTVIHDQKFLNPDGTVKEPYPLSPEDIAEGQRIAELGFAENVKTWPEY